MLPTPVSGTPAAVEKLTQDQVKSVKINNFQMKNCDTWTFHIAPNIDCGSHTIYVVRTASYCTTYVLNKN